MKLFYYSELLDKSFDTEQACLNAERKHTEQKKAEAQLEKSVENAKLDLKSAKEKLTQVRALAQEVYDKREAEAMKEYDTAVSPAVTAVKEAEKHLQIVEEEYNREKNKDTISCYDYNKWFNDIKDEVKTGRLWDLFTY